MSATQNKYASRWAIVPRDDKEHEQFDLAIALDYCANDGVERYTLSRPCLYFVAWESIRRAEYANLLCRRGSRYDARVIGRIINHIERNVTAWEIRVGAGGMLIYIHALGPRPVVQWPQWVTVHRGRGSPSRLSVEEAFRAIPSASLSGWRRWVSRMAQAKP